MYFSSLIFVAAVSNLATFSIATSEASNANDYKIGPLTYVVSQNINWANGTFYDEKGDVAFLAKRFGNNISFISGDRIVSSIPSPSNPCDPKIVESDSRGVVFKVYNHTLPSATYAWGIERSDGASFLWKPFSGTSDDLIYPIAGTIVNTKSNNATVQITEGNPDGFPVGLIEGVTFRILIEGPADVSSTPGPYDVLELVYLLSFRNRNCKIIIN